MSNEKMADTVCEETGAQKLLFHTCHNVTKAEFESGATYLSLMQNNVLALQKGARLNRKGSRNLAYPRRQSGFMAFINVQNASFRYDGKEVVRDLQFAVERGDYLCVVGENGSGKSTLVKGLLGLKAPSSGSISFEDGLRAREIGYLPQQKDSQRDFPASVQEVVLSGTLNSLGLTPVLYEASNGRLRRRSSSVSA